MVLYSVQNGKRFITLVGPSRATMVAQTSQAGKKKAAEPVKLEVSDEYRQAVNAFVDLDDQLINARYQVREIREKHRQVERVLFLHVRKSNHPRSLCDGGRCSIAAQDVRSKQAINPQMIRQAAIETGISEPDVDKLIAAIEGKRRVTVSHRIARTIYEV
jgi:hypothetical protein